MDRSNIFKNVTIPIFPFPKTIISYIFANANVEHYKKLNKTCKYIFARYQKNCIYWLHLIESPISKPKPLFESYNFITHRETDFNLLSSNLWIFGYLELNRASTILYKSFIPKISTSTINNLTLTRCADFSYDDYKFLTASGEITTLYLHDTKIVYSNGEPVEFEKILAQVVNAQFININPIHVTKKTMENLLNIQWGKPNNLMMFRLAKIDNNYLDPHKFFTLLKKIACMSVMIKNISGRYYVNFNEPESTVIFNQALLQLAKEYKEPEAIVTEEQS